MLNVAWSPSSDSGVNGYEVSYSPMEGLCDGVLGGAVMVEGRTTRTYTLTNLQAYTEYSITVRARGADGLGPPSTPRVERTEADSELNQSTDSMTCCDVCPFFATRSSRPTSDGVC